MAADIITYYQLDPALYYEGCNDITKLCSLTGAEIDNNFYVLEGRDIKAFYRQGDFLVIELFNGEKLLVDFNGSGTGGCCDYTTEHGIDPDALAYDHIINSDALLIKTTQDIEVLNVEIGSYKSGDVIPQGTSVEEILTNMLRKINDVDVTLPSTSISASLNSYIEVGSTLNMVSVTGHYHDGAFSRTAEGYSIDAGCPIVAEHFTYSFTGTDVTVPSGIHSYTWTNINVAREGLYTFGTYVDYGASTNTPIKSDGTPSDVKIIAGTTSTASKSFTGAYKYFYGYVPKDINNDYTNVITSKSDLSKLSGAWIMSNTVTINEMESSTQNSALALVIPSDYTILSTNNSFGMPVTVSEKWVLRNSITYTNGTSTKTYDVYIMHALYSIKYKDIIFSKN